MILRINHYLVALFIFLIINSSCSIYKTNKASAITQGYHFVSKENMKQYALPGFALGCTEYRVNIASLKKSKLLFSKNRRVKISGYVERFHNKEKMLIFSSVGFYSGDTLILNKNKELLLDGEFEFSCTLKENESVFFYLPGFVIKKLEM